MPMTHSISFLRRYSKGFYYVEVLVTTFLIAVALVPTMNALQTGISGGEIQKTLVTQQYHRIGKMEELLAESFDDLVAAAQAAGDEKSPSGYSDAPGATNRRLVYLALYDADADPFVVADPDEDGDNNVYTGSSANLIWLRVETEGTPHGLETLLSR